MTEARDETNEAKRRIQSTEIRLTELCESLEKERSSLDSTRTEYTELQSRFDHLQADNERLQRELAAAHQQSARLVASETSSAEDVQVIIFTFTYIE